MSILKEHIQKHTLILGLAAMVVFLAGAWVTGCNEDGGETTEEPKTCTLDTDCDYGMECNFRGECQEGTACTVDENCPMGEHCNTLQGVCQVTTDPCNGQCTADQTCIFGQCKTVCTTDAQCTAEEFCDLSSGQGLCTVRPATDGDADPDTDGDVTEDTDNADPAEEDLVDNGGRAEGEACVASSECNSGLSCFKYVCRKICNPEAETTGCPQGKLCHLPIDVTDGDLYGTGKGVCLDRDPSGGNIGDPCYADLACQVDLVCLHNDRCVEVCDPDSESSCAADNEYCVLQNDLGTGFCLTCGDGAECPENTACNEETNTCDPLVSCLDSPETCVLPDVCNRSTGFCEDGCQITGCATGFCNRATGYCEYTCVPACSEGSCCNGPNSCGECCDPPCPGGQMCLSGNICQESTDCRLNTSLCQEETLQCNPDTGECDRICPSSCPAGEFCDNERTGGYCRAPNPNECSPQYPAGLCPDGYICNNGLCISTCIPDLGVCDGFSSCCNGTTCCLNMMTGGGMCCAAGTECMLGFGMCM